MRLERDPLGTMEVQDDMYYGIQTRRAMDNFRISGIHESGEMIRSYALVKKAAAMANMELGMLDKERGDAIIAAADHIIAGDLNDQFPVDVFQAGAGTSFNMNMNEVLANKALEILGRKKGDYEHLGPNDHVNMGQSSNDTFPTALHIASIEVCDHLLGSLESLSIAFRERSEEHSDVAKTGRTHLMDALPVLLGNELRAYGVSIDRSAIRIRERRDDLLEVPIGGTAVGTGANAHPLFRKVVVRILSEITSLPLRPATDPHEALQSRAQSIALSSACRELALEVVRMTNDIRLMSSGPFSGLGEIELPEVQPGSSMMPGKINPSIAECVAMVCFQVIGNDTAIALAGQAGQLELNAMSPLIAFDTLWSMSILTAAIDALREKCIAGIIANRERCEAELMRNPILVTLLSPNIGYLRAADLARTIAATDRRIDELVVEMGILSPDEAKELFDPKKMAEDRQISGGDDPMHERSPRAERRHDLVNGH